MKTRIFLIIAALSLPLVAVSLVTGNRVSGLSQVPEAQNALEKLAKELKLNVGKITNRGAERNMLGFKSDNLLFSQRNDSRTYFIQDNRYGVTNPAGVFQGTDEDALRRSRAFLRSFGISVDELGKASVLREKNQ